MSVERSSHGPRQWPKQADMKYEKIRALGKGAYGEVWLAKRRHEPHRSGEEPQYNARNRNEQSPNATSCDEYVAIKAISVESAKRDAYARREIEALTELSHPHIVQLMDVIEKDSACTNMCLALQYARGPTLEQVIQTGGALGLPLARLVSRQLVAVVSYLHTRGVIHRDLKPENVLLEGADLDDDDLWSDRHKIEKYAYDKWKVVLIDFGISRPLRSDEVETEVKALNEFNQQETEDRRPSSSAVHALDHRLPEEANGTTSRKPPESSTDGRKETSDGCDTRGSTFYLKRGSSKRHGRRRSISATIVKRLSAIGTKFYAAPEIADNCRRKCENPRDMAVGRLALSVCVADYGLTADAFSLGSILREALTGVPAKGDISEYIAEHECKDSSLCGTLSRMFGCKSERRIRTFRREEELPKTAMHLIRGFMEVEPKERTTVRAAQFHPWIVGEDGYSLPQGDVPSGPGEPLVLLNCAVQKS